MLNKCSSQLGISKASGFWCSETLRPHGKGPSPHSPLDKAPTTEAFEWGFPVFVLLENS